MRRLTMRAVLVAGSMLLASGCGAPLLVQVETVVRPDGSCDRLIWQPKGEMLPDGALTPAWNARWRGVKDVIVPPAFSDGNPRPRDRAYFHAHGGFASPAEIPAHFLARDKNYPDVGASELTRSYERKDLGFVVEHCWSETVTNIVTREKFIQARDEFLEIGLPLLCEGIEEVYGDRYDVSRVVADVRTRGRLLLDDLATAYFDMMKTHDYEDDHAMSVRFAGVFHRLGVAMFDDKGGLVSKEESARRISEFARAVVRDDFRRRDGRPLADDEVQSILDSSAKPPYNAAWSNFLTSHQEVVKTRLGPLLLRMTGLYGYPIIFAPPAPQFAFSVRLPGRIVEAETNGTIADSGQVRWNFDGRRVFPDGFRMKAVSIDFNEEMQRSLLDEVVIVDLESARSYRELVGDEGELLDLVRRACKEKNIQLVREARAENDLEQARLTMLRRLLRITP